MVDIKSDNMNDIYLDICRKLQDGRQVGNTKEILNYSFELTDMNNNVITIRDISVNYLCGELLWYVLGRNDTEFINKFASMWGRISDDGVHANSAYGDILIKRHGFNQIKTIIRLLKEDPNTRRAVLNFNVPNKNVIETKDEICTIMIQLVLRDGELNGYTVMRSNDVYFGLPYDVVFFTELIKHIANELNVELGHYIHQVTSLHVYDNFVERLKYLKNDERKFSIDFSKLLDYSAILESVVDNNDKITDQLITECERLGVLSWN